MLIETTTFFICKVDSGSSSWGGAMRVDDGNFVMNRVCGSKCYSSGRYSFAYIREADSPYRDMNYVIESSISQCEAVKNYAMVHVPKARSLLFLRENSQKFIHRAVFND